MARTEEPQPSRVGWRYWARGLLVVGVALAGLGAECVDATVSSENDGGSVRDVATAVDAGAGDCRAVNGAETCRRRSGCQWLTATCDGGRIVGGCYAGSGWMDASLDCSIDRDGAGSADVGANGCEAVGGEADCRARSACRWWTATCGDRVVEQRCVDREASPRPPSCDAGDVSEEADVSDTQIVDAGTPSDGGTEADTGAASDASAPDADLDAGVACRMHSNASDCRTDDRCKWWVDSCDGYVIEETCVSKHESPTPTQCKEIPPEECHDVDGADACRPPNCEWVAEGCGSGPDDTAEVTACLPEGRCSDNTDCPTDHLCVHLWVDVCHGAACQACGGETTRCVPSELLNP